MKKPILLFTIALTSVIAMAQVEVKSIEALPGTQDKGFCFPQFSPKGDYLLLTTNGYKGLVQYTLSDRSLKTLTEADNAGYEAKVSEGGKVVVYRDVQYRENLRYTAIKEVNVETGDVVTLDAPSREKYAFDFSAGTIRIAKRTSMISKRLVNDLTPAENSYVIAIEDMNLVLYTNNQRRVLNPQGEGSYIWPVISPDHKHIVYVVSQGNKTGTYVCDMNGDNVVCLGYVGAPKWLGNDYIVGMLDLWDDGHKYTRSPLVSIRIDGENRQVMDIPGHAVILCPAASAQGDKIAFEADGKVYLMHVAIKED